MKTMSAKELRNRTAEALQALRHGESVLITFRGKPLGTLVPYAPVSRAEASPRPYEEAWPEIEATLRRTRPRFVTWREAEEATRGRRPGRGKRRR